MYVWHKYKQRRLYAYIQKRFARNIGLRLTSEVAACRRLYALSTSRRCWCHQPLNPSSVNPRRPRDFCGCSAGVKQSATIDEGHLLITDLPTGDWSLNFSVSHLVDSKLFLFLIANSQGECHLYNSLSVKFVNCLATVVTVIDGVTSMSTFYNNYKYNMKTFV